MAVVQLRMVINDAREVMHDVRSHSIVVQEQSALQVKQAQEQLKDERQHSEKLRNDLDSRFTRALSELTQIGRAVADFPVHDALMEKLDQLAGRISGLHDSTTARTRDDERLRSEVAKINRELAFLKDLVASLATHPTDRRDQDVAPASGQDGFRVHDSESYDHE
jgi:chromosome segregation ATPase